MWKQANTQLIQTNVTWLRQAIDLVEKLDDAVFATKVGAHLRHIAEFYECFLNGLETACTTMTQGSETSRSRRTGIVPSRACGP